VLGLVFDRHVQVGERVMQPVAKEFLQARKRLDSDPIPRSTDLTEVIGNPSLTIERRSGVPFRDAAAVFGMRPARSLAAAGAQC